MTNDITIRIDHPSGELGPIEGFRFFWAYYVNGFDQTRHCQDCFKGTLSRQINTSTARTGQLYVMDEERAFKYIYICGVGSGPRNELRNKNFHLPLRYEAGAIVVRHTYKGHTVTVTNSVELPIPKLAPGWNGLMDKEHTGCRNFQFGVEYFGWTVK